MDTKKIIEQLEQEGYKDVKLHSFDFSMDFGEHKHELTTVHVIVEGELFLKDQDGEMTRKAGERFEIPAGATHSAKCGPSGCKFIAGVKK